MGNIVEYDFNVHFQTHQFCTYPWRLSRCFVDYYFCFLFTVHSLGIDMCSCLCQSVSKNNKFTNPWRSDSMWCFPSSCGHNGSCWCNTTQPSYSVFRIFCIAIIFSYPLIAVYMCCSIKYPYPSDRGFLVLKPSS